MTTVVKIAKFVHNLYDSRIDPNSKTDYHGHFIGGVNQYYNQTNNCLILEGYYGIPASKIHTPLGYWSISGSGCGKHKIINQHIHQNIELKMLCPGYQTQLGYYGPYWLITSFNGHPVPHPEKELLPAHRDLEISKNSEDQQILKRYQEQMSFFYKNRSNYIEYNQAKKIFDKYLGKWLRSGLIRDKRGLSIEILNNQKPVQAFKSLISPKSHDYVFGSSSVNDIIFKAIYLSESNVNIE